MLMDEKSVCSPDFTQTCKEIHKEKCGHFLCTFVTLGHCSVLYKNRGVSSEMTKNANALTAGPSDLLTLFSIDKSANGILLSYACRTFLSSCPCFFFVLQLLEEI